jgi:hypothetical protein
MITMKRLLSVTLVTSALAVSPAAVAADGIVLQRSALPVRVQTDLAAQIAQARAKDPSSFVTVREAVARASAVDAKARGHKAPVGRYLAALGPSALLPLLEIAAFDAPATEVTPKLRRDVVEGIGLLRDARALPVLGAIVERDTDDDVVRTAAEAMGRIGGDDAASALLSSFAAAKGSKRTAIASGMSDCRRLSIASALFAEIAKKPDEATARVLAKALGNVANAWAWKTLASRAEEGAVREAAARALVATFVSYSAEARDAASNALMLVDAPQTPSLIAAARSGASPDTLAALDALSARFAKNPAR